MRPRVFSSVPIGSCTAWMPRSPQTTPQRPIAVSKNVTRYWVMAVQPFGGLAESRYESGCGPPDFRGNFPHPPPPFSGPAPMQTLDVNRYDMAYLDIGRGLPLVCVHGSLCDFRIW